MNVGRALFYSVAFLLVLGSVASAAPSVKLHFSGSLIQTTGGKVLHKPIQGLTLHQGDVVEYAIDATNSGDQAALGFTTVGPVPAHMQYVAGSARGEQPSRIEYSIDGKTWSPRPAQVVKTAHGSLRKPAPAALYVSVRFTAIKALAPKATFHYSYEAVVK